MITEIENRIIIALDDVHIEDGSSVAHQYVVNKVLSALKPTTLDEALRDFAMFGKFVADECGGMTLGTQGYFIEDWIVWRRGEIDTPTSSVWPSFLSFVKEEMEL